MTSHSTETNTNRSTATHPNGFTDLERAIIEYGAFREKLQMAQAATAFRQIQRLLSQSAVPAAGKTPRVDALLREIKPHEGDPLWKDTARLIDLAKAMEIEHGNLRALLWRYSQSAIGITFTQEELDSLRDATYGWTYAPAGLRQKVYELAVLLSTDSTRRDG